MTLRTKTRNLTTLKILTAINGGLTSSFQRVYKPEAFTLRLKSTLAKSNQCDMERVFNNKICAKGRCVFAFEFLQQPSWQQQGNGKIEILLKTKKAVESSNDKLMRYVFSLEDKVAHMAISNLSRILTIEK